MQESGLVVFGSHSHSHIDLTQKQVDLDLELKEFQTDFRR